MKEKMPPFKRKKSAGKSFPVKVCTLDAELEFNLEVYKKSTPPYCCIIFFPIHNMYKYLFS